MTLVKYYPVLRQNSVKYNNSNSNYYTPTIRSKTTENEYVVTFSTPGLPKEAISVEIKDQTLKVSTKKVEGLNYNFEKSFKLPQLIDADNITAEYKDGLLTISIPKKESKIQIEVQ